MHKRYGDRVTFLAIYVREAHPTNGWRMESNDKAGISIVQPMAKSDRLAVADRCCSTLELSMPLLVDDMNDRVGHAYSGMPDRMYLIDKEGRVAYKGGRGPFGFLPAELEQSLVMLLLEKPASPEKPKSISILENSEAWKYLPHAEKGGGVPLPGWARALARTLPRTTAALLELDYSHRAKSPLDPKLRGTMRWVAAHANHCAYTEAIAAADLRRAGVSDLVIQSLAGDFSDFPEREKVALIFARQLTRAADTVTDAQVGKLMKLYGQKDLVAMVLLLAYANFQDRLVLALNLPPEAISLSPPVEIHFAKKENQEFPKPPARISPKESHSAKVSQRVDDPEWLEVDYTHLQLTMESQRGRAGRIPVPSWETVRPLMPSNYPSDKPLRIRWSLVCLGYQPELAAGWSACTRAFAQESEQDRVFEESLFWVITRTLHCFY
jgi:alkylhydroperoxidase family enzyme